MEKLQIEHSTVWTIFAFRHLVAHFQFSRRFDTRYSRSSSPSSSFSSDWSFAHLQITLLLLFSVGSTCIRWFKCCIYCQVNLQTVFLVLLENKKTKNKKKKTLSRKLAILLRWSIVDAVIDADVIDAEMREIQHFCCCCSFSFCIVLFSWVLNDDDGDDDFCGCCRRLTSWMVSPLWRRLRIIVIIF